MGRTWTINCDIGERGFGHADDYALLPIVDVLNIAVGGHAGTPATAHDLYTRSCDAGKAATIHCSFPDRINFGRTAWRGAWSELRDCLSAQRAWLPAVSAVKPHGALYNQLVHDQELAAQFLAWCVSQQLDEVVCPSYGVMAAAAEGTAVGCTYEAFADRAYDTAAERLCLRPRGEVGAVMTDSDHIIRHVQNLVRNQGITIDGTFYAMQVETVCVHSDSPGALAHAQVLRQWRAQQQ